MGQDSQGMPVTVGRDEASARFLTPTLTLTLTLNLTLTLTLNLTLTLTLTLAHAVALALALTLPPSDEVSARFPHGSASVVNPARTPNRAPWEAQIHTLEVRCGGSAHDIG